MSEPWSNQTRLLLIIFGLVLISGFIYFIRPLIGPIVISALLAFLLQPIVGAMHTRLKMKNKLSAGLVFLVFLLVLLAVPAGFTPFVIRQTTLFNRELRILQASLEQSLAQVQIGDFSFPADSLSLDFQTIFTELLHPEQLIEYVTFATENVIIVFMILVTAYYLLVDWRRLFKWAFNAVPEPLRPDVWRLYERIKVVWQIYLRGQLLLMTILGVVSGIAALAIGLPGPLIVGILAAILALIPSFGTSTTAVIVGVVGLLVGSTYLSMSNIWFGILVLILFFGIHFLETYWLRPLIMGQSLQLHPALVIISVIGALSLGGVLAVLIIVPLLSTADILGTYFYRRILGRDPWTKPVQVEEEERVSGAH
ncbi:MAG: AI-2E family transporter [Anaerolineales bacterium]|nr:AI-2E family transporter [Anaerolineales bacterium]